VNLFFLNLTRTRYSKLETRGFLQLETRNSTRKILADSNSKLDSNFSSTRGNPGREEEIRRLREENDRREQEVRRLENDERRRQERERERNREKQARWRERRRQNRDQQDGQQ